ncbi:hypothetical protein MM326_13980 [Alkalihalobacillus sp. LMS6]|jgi:hypothetical protein|uniref:hypothetical protein n=1 Tax=Alkalihalobacillus sp. LMS6 TaxID=2924034 RepID=UPI0020D0D027|nr:hypothetical protein [Alkalihalobacillus sp. LMS6]UTR05212.1 hypothetical protein MM326_13980 [Alkalihalobacillus sp. LMS6]
MFAPSLTPGTIKLVSFDIDGSSEVDRVRGWIDLSHKQAYYQIGEEFLMSGYNYNEASREYDVSLYDRVQLLNSSSVITDREFISIFFKLEKMSLHTFLREHFDKKLDYNFGLETILND